jgi:hypothetical protein
MAGAKDKSWGSKMQVASTVQERHQQGALPFQAVQWLQPVSEQL